MLSRALTAVSSYIIGRYRANGVRLSAELHGDRTGERKYKLEDVKF